MCAVAMTIADGAICTSSHPRLWNAEISSVYFYRKTENRKKILQSRGPKMVVSLYYLGMKGILGFFAHHCFA
jgi:hypothetical protein